MSGRFPLGHFPPLGRFEWVVVIDGAGHFIQLPSLTTAERNALTAVNGMQIYNSTTNQIEDYDNGAWRARGQLAVNTHTALTTGVHGVTGTVLGTEDVDDTPVDGATTAPVSSNWAYDHAAALDAHTRDMGQILRTGEYVVPVPADTTRIRSITADRLYGVLLWLARDITVDRIAIDVTIAGAGGTKARLGIYNVGTNLYPGSLLLDAGTVAVDATGVKSITINQSLTKGLYFTALVSDGIPTIAGLWARWSPLGVYSVAFNGGQQVQWLKAQAYGALPDPFTAAGGMSTLTAAGIYVRVLSLD